MTLHEPINFSDLLQKPIVFRVDPEQSFDKMDDDLLKDDPDISEKKDDESIISPWLESFDALKATMIIPIRGNNDIYKRIISEGNGEVLGRRKCRIQWTYSVFFEGEEKAYDSSYMCSANVKTSECDTIIFGIWLALETMRKGEEAHFIIGYKLMYGKLGDMVGSTKIKPQADVLLVAKLIDFVETGTGDACEKLTEQELHHYSTVKTKAIEVQKNLNDLHGQRRFNEATLRALDIIQRLRFSEVANAEEEKDRERFLIDVYVKLIDCHVKREQFKKACNAIAEMRKLTKLDNFVDVLVNEAIARSKIDENYDKSIELMRKAQLRHPNNQLIHDTLNDLLTMRNKYKNEMKNFMMKAFQQKPQPAATQLSPEKQQNNSELTDIIKSFDSIDIGDGIPLVGYTPDELEMVKNAVENAPNYKLQPTRNPNGKVEYIIKRAD